MRKNSFKKRIVSYCIVAIMLFTIALSGSVLPTAAASLISNGDFSNGISPWTTTFNNGSSGTFQAVDGWGTVSMTSGGTYKADVMLKQVLGMDLVAGTTYTISLSAKASISMQFDLVVRTSGNSNIFVQYGIWAKTTAENYTYTFTPTESYTGAHIGFRVGSQAADIQFDNVSIGSGKLTWAPPALVNPVTINLTETSNPGTLKTGVDYIINLPSTTRTRGVYINGGRNVVIIGGHIQMPAYDSTQETYTGRAFYIKNGDAGRVVHIEGVLMTITPESQVDFVAIDDDNAIVQVQNCRAEGVQGSYDQWHADIIQPWGGVAQLRIDGLTASSSYQGLQLTQDLGPCGSYDLKNINITALPEWYAGAKGGYMMWLTTGTKAVPMTLSNVYITPRTGRSLGKTVWPDIDATDVTTRPTISNGYLTWPGLSHITGGITEGTPPRGDFVPAGTAGIGYVSPGYI